MTESVHRPKRSGLLITMTILMAVFQVLTLFLFVMTAIDRTTHGQDVPTILLVSAALVVVALAGFVGIWFWKRWAAYLLATVVVAGLVVDLVGGVPVPSLLVRVALIVTLGFAVAKQWDEFR